MITMLFFMLRNYITAAVRYLRKNKVFSLLNILGLACCMLIALFVSDEVSYDSELALSSEGSPLKWEFENNASVMNLCFTSDSIPVLNAFEILSIEDVALMEERAKVEFRIRSAKPPEAFRC